MWYFDLAVSRHQSHCTHACRSVFSPSFPFFLLLPTGTTPRRISGGANETTVPKLRLQSPTAISLFSLRDGPLGHAEWSSSLASSKDSHQNKRSGGGGEGGAASTDEKCGHKESEMGKSSVAVRARAGGCTYLDDGRWWSDPVVAAGCMVLCLATCVLIIAELGVCGCQKELLQLNKRKWQRRRVGSECGLFKWPILFQLDRLLSPQAFCLFSTNPEADKILVWFILILNLVMQKTLLQVYSK